MVEVLISLTSPSEALQRAEVVARVREAVGRLDPTDREILALRHFEELSNRETAALLGLQPAAASKRHVRALERLKAAVGRTGGPGEGTAMNDEHTAGRNAAGTMTVSGGDFGLLDDLAEEFACRCRNGEAPSIAEYEARYPGQAEKLRGLLETVALMEQVKRGGAPGAAGRRGRRRNGSENSGSSGSSAGAGWGSFTKRSRSRSAARSP